MTVISAWKCPYPGWKEGAFQLQKLSRCLFFPPTNKTAKHFPQRQISKLLIITGNDLFTVSASQPSLGAGVMQGNNEPSGRGGRAAVGDAARQKPIPQAWQEQRTQGLSVGPASHPHKPLENLFLPALSRLIVDFQLCGSWAALSWWLTPCVVTSRQPRWLRWAQALQAPSLQPSQVIGLQEVWTEQA